jgi:methylated-DNA-[protein]-cysteine S-methyltransferase
MKIELSHLDSPLGGVMLAASEAGLVALSFAKPTAVRTELARTHPGAELRDGGVRVRGFARRVEAYFGGELDAIDDLPVAPVGTPFQTAVWRALRQIPCGRTVSYRDVARAVGRALAVRAAGGAIGKNPIAIVVPCHRVIGADGSLCGFGAGLPRKRWLLAHEGATPAELPLG